MSVRLYLLVSTRLILTIQSSDHLNNGLYSKLCLRLVYIVFTITYFLMFFERTTLLRFLIKYYTLLTVFVTIVTSNCKRRK